MRYEDEEIDHININHQSKCILRRTKKQKKIIIKN